jgi:3'(2'), 5'-bisphosphate nucleotidase
MEKEQVLDLVSQRLRELILLVREAGERVLSVYANEFDVVLKSDLSPLTLADSLSHEILFASLPGIVSCPVLSEEGAEIPYSERSAWPAFWSIDPLDGTKEFVRKSGDFCVSVGLVVGSTPIFGVIYIPVGNQIYFGGKGFGSYRIAKETIDSLENLDSKALLSSAIRLDTGDRNLRRHWVLLGSVSHGAEMPSELTKTLFEKERFDSYSIGSAIKFCRIAEGFADFYPRYGTTMEWDTSAGQAIVLGAGGAVVAIETGSPLKYNKRDLENPDFYCFGGRFRKRFPEIMGTASPP